MAWDQKKWYQEVGKHKAKEYYKNNRARILKNTKDYLSDINNKRKQQVHIAKSRAEKKGVPFTITVEDIEWVEVCPILEIPLSYSGDKWNSPSLDKIDPTLGYVPGNVRVISQMANSMKAHATKEQLATFAKNIMRYMENS